jgi:hypothetical protein
MSTLLPRTEEEQLLRRAEEPVRPADDRVDPAGAVFRAHPREDVVHSVVQQRLHGHRYPRSTHLRDVLTADSSDVSWQNPGQTTLLTPADQLAEVKAIVDAQVLSRGRDQVEFGQIDDVPAVGVPQELPRHYGTFTSRALKAQEVLIRSGQKESTNDPHDAAASQNSWCSAHTCIPLRKVPTTRGIRAE